MKFCVLFLSFCILYCRGFLFDNCRTDSDCKNGCCRLSGSLGLSQECVHTFLQLHQTCHLNGHEYLNCGCAQGLTCVDHMDTGGQAIAVEGGGAGGGGTSIVGYGYCEKANGTSHSGGSQIATEG